MAEADRPSAAPRAATFALAAAGLLALGAVGVRTLGGQTAAPVGNAAAPAGEAESAETTIATLRERLREDPDNDAGWYHLGLLYRGSGLFAEAEQVFRRAMQLRPRNPDYVAYLGEILLLKGGREPPPEAEQLFRRALELQPGNPQARYYLATLRDLRGDHRGAIDALVDLLGDAEPDSPWEPQVREAALTIARQNGIDLGSRLPPPRASTAAAAIPGPTSEQLEAARSIPPSRQDAMARGMVDRLAGRLRAEPRNADGWIMLMRSRMQLREPQGAGEALRSALAAFPDDATTRQRLRGAARELGVPGA